MAADDPTTDDELQPKGTAGLPSTGAGQAAAAEMGAGIQPDLPPGDSDDDTHAPAPTELKNPVRLGIGIFMGTTMWVLPFIALNGVLIPAKLAIVMPDQKVQMVATLAAVGAVVALFANILFGAFSDLTRSKFGRRNPWMFLGSIGTCVAVLIFSGATHPAAIIGAWCLFQLSLNAIVAPMVAVIPDRVPEEVRGTFSAIYGVSFIVGNSLGMLVGSRFISNPQTGMIIVAVILLLQAPVFTLLAPDFSTKHLPRKKFSASMLLENFVFPLKGARDFYLALSGKMFFILGTFAVNTYLLYILTDYMKQSNDQASNVMSTIAIINLITGLVFGTLSGPLSDRLGRRRKIFVMGSALLVGIAAIFPFLWAQPWALLVFAALAGIGNGIFNSVDQALNYEVLPNPDTQAKDLAILNMANTGGQMLAPAFTSQIVGLFGGYGPVFLASIAVMVISASLIKPIKKAR